MLNEHCRCTVEDHMMCAGRVPIFSSLDKEDLKHVVSMIVQRKYPMNTLITKVGTIHQSLIIVSKGKIKVSGYSPEGKEQIMYLLAEGDFFGARNLLHDKESEFNIQAIEDTVVCAIEKNNFQKLLREFPEISLKIMQVLCDRLDKMESMFRKISPKDVDSRINMLLLEFSNKYGRRQENGILIELPMTKLDMASYIGVARETLSRKLTSLKEEGIIEIVGKKKILIIDEEALQFSI